MPSSSRSRSISPPSPRVPTPTASDFPVPASQTFTVPKRDQGLVSPAESAFSFFDEGSPHVMSTSDLMEERTRARPIDRGTPGESTYASINTGDQQQNDLRRNKSQYYTEVFSYREPNLSPRDRIGKDSVITAEIKTNVIVRAHLLASDADADRSAYSRLPTKSTSCKISPNIYPKDTKDLFPPYSYPSTIPNASSMRVLSTKPIASPSLAYPRNSFPRQTNATPP